MQCHNKALHSKGAIINIQSRKNIHAIETAFQTHDLTNSCLLINICLQSVQQINAGDFVNTLIIV